MLFTYNIAYTYFYRQHLNLSLVTRRLILTTSSKLEASTRIAFKSWKGQAGELIGTTNSSTAQPLDAACL